MRWRQPLPPWARPLVAVFGLAIIVDVLWQRDELALVGAVIGVLWLVFGWKGFPLLEAQGSRSADTMDAACAVLRRRRIGAILWPWAFGLLSIGLAPLGIHEPGIVLVFFLAGAFVPIAYCVFSACPRCHQHYFMPSGAWAKWTSRCCHCSLPIGRSGDAT